MKMEKKNPANVFADNDFYCIEWVKEIKRKWMKERFGEVLFFSLSPFKYARFTSSFNCSKWVKC